MCCLYQGAAGVEPHTAVQSSRRRELTVVVSVTRTSGVGRLLPVKGVAEEAFAKFSVGSNGVCGSEESWKRDLQDDCSQALIFAAAEKLEKVSLDFLASAKDQLAAVSQGYWGPSLGWPGLDS